MKKSKKSIVLLLLLFFTFSGCIFSINKDKGKNSDDSGAVREETDTKNNMGINLWYLNSWSDAHTFVDVMKEADFGWSKYDTVLKQNITVEIDEYGNPKSDGSKMLWNGTENDIGTYSLVFKGKAENIDVRGATKNGVVKEIYYDEKTNTTKAKVEISEKSIKFISFKGTRRTPDSEVESGITDIHLYRPGYPDDGSVVFTKELVSAVSKFQVIRFMEWNSTNLNPSTNWEERTLPEYLVQERPLSNLMLYSDKYGRTGVAFEYMIMLCNETNSDMWVNVPVNVDDQYIEELAKLIHYGRKGADGKDYPPLKSNLKLYIEYGNEIWNNSPGFFGMTWIGELVKVAQRDSNHPIIFDGNKDFIKGIYRYVGWRTVTISNIFRKEFGDKQMMTRIRPVIEGQLGCLTYLSSAFEFIEKYYSISRDGLEANKPVSYFIYGCGGSAYYGINMDKATAVDGEYVVNHYFDEGMYPDEKWVKQIREEAIFAKNYGLKRVAYEGGPGLDVYKVLNQKQKREINLNPKMKDMVIKYQNIWSENDGDLLCYYCLGAAAPWEFTSTMIKDSTGAPYSLEAPKMLAIEELNSKERASISFGNSIEKEIIISDTDLITRLKKDMPGYNYDLKMNIIGGADIFGMALNVKKEGRYKMIMKGRVYGDPVLNPDKGISEVRLNGTLIGNINLKVNGLGGVKSAIENSTEIEMYIPKGMSVIRVTNLNRMAVYSLTFTEVIESSDKKNVKKNNYK